MRRWTILTGLLSVLTAGLLAFLCMRLPLEQSAFVMGQEVAFGRPVVIVGRTLVLDPAGQAWLTLVFALATVFYMVAWRINQGRLYFSVSLGILSLYSFVALVQNFAIAVLVFGISATPAMFMVLGKVRGPIRGAQRYLLVTLLSAPLLLAAAWMVEQGALSPEGPRIVRAALLPAALGFGMLLAIFPFGTWMPALAADSPPLTTAFLLTAGQAMTVFLAVMFVRVLPLSLQDPVALRVVQVAGVVTIVSAGVMAAVQRDLGRLFGYAALSDLGYFALAAGTGGSQGVTLALVHLVSRSISIALLAASLAIIRSRVKTDAFTQVGGLTRALPFASIGFILGGLALAGFPFTAGFPTHWAVARAASSEQWVWALPLLLSSLGIIVGLLRALGSMAVAVPRRASRRQPIFASLVVLVLAGLVVYLGVQPHLFLEPIRGAVRSLSLF
jgi:formate hydrogenlyase subunit 3/multisubunit Na+/H+ antiporter MnhD subunit